MITKVSAAASIKSTVAAEMRAMSFRQPQNYALMLLIMAAFLALGRRRSLRVFELLALTAATLFGFRIQREAWMAAPVAVAILADASARIARDRESQEESRAWWENAACAVMLAAISTWRGPSGSSRTEPSANARISRRRTS